MAILPNEIIASDLPERFCVLRHQEDNLYSYPDYLSEEFQENQFRKGAQKDSKESCLFLSDFDLISSSSSGVKAAWREAMCEWSYKVVDHYDLSRETVNVSVSYLDRILALRSLNSEAFQLAAMTCLYIAVKIYETSKLTPSSLVELSRGIFTNHHVLSMEKAILQALSWKLHPPTSLSFVREFLLLVKTSNLSENHNIFETSRFLTELGVCDYFFVIRKTSSLALASLLNAFELTLSEERRMLASHQFSKAVRDIALLDCFHDEVEECRIRLKELYWKGNYEVPHAANHLDSIFPTNVLTACDHYT